MRYRSLLVNSKIISTYKMHAAWFLVVAAFFVTPTSSTEPRGEFKAFLLSLKLLCFFSKQPKEQYHFYNKYNININNTNDENNTDNTLEKIYIASIKLYGSFT